jgi:hypothetical protein
MQLSRSRGKIAQGVPSSRPVYGDISAWASIAECERVAPKAPCFSDRSTSGRAPEPRGKAPPTYAGAAAPFDRFRHIASRDWPAEPLHLQISEVFELRNPFDRACRRLMMPQEGRGRSFVFF